MKIINYEGGIPYEVDIDVPSMSPAGRAAFERFIDSIPCSCGGEAHDECRKCDECGEAPALNEVQDDPEGGTMSLCDRCYEAAVEAEEHAFNMQRAEDEQDRIADLLEDEAAMRFDAWYQRQKENRS